VGGFMEGAITRKDGEAVLTFNHYSPQGELLHTYQF